MPRGFLDSDRFRKRRRALEDAFRQSPVRPAAHAGGAYAGEAAALQAQIDGFLFGAQTDRGLAAVTGSFIRSPRLRLRLPGR